MSNGTINKRILLGIAWLGTLALAWFVGASGITPAANHAHRTGGEPTSVKLVPVREDRPDADTQRELDRTTTTTRAAGAQREHASEPMDDADIATFTLEGVESIDDVSARLMKYAAAKLAGGPEAQLELFRTVDELTQNADLKHFVNDERDVAHLIYPWVRFLVSRDKQIVRMMETIYRTGAEDPSRFDGIDDDTFEIFTEGVAFLLPGVVAPEQLGRLREYAQRIVDTPKEQLPKGLRSNRKELERNIKWWTGPLAPDVLRARVLDPNVPADERLKLIADANPQSLAGLDLVGFLSDQLRDGNRRVYSALRRLKLSASDKATLDQTAISAVVAREMDARQLRNYLRSTGRWRWPAAREFIEDGLRQGGEATSTFASLIHHDIAARSDKEFVRHVLATYALAEDVAKELKGNAGID